MTGTLLENISQHSVSLRFTLNRLLHMPQAIQTKCLLIRLLSDSISPGQRDWEGQETGRAGKRKERTKWEFEEYC